MWHYSNEVKFIMYCDHEGKDAFVNVDEISFVNRPEKTTLIHLKDGTVLSSADSVETIFRRIGE